jgi:deoxycytidine triphosphate deaminase
MLIVGQKILDEGLLQNAAPNHIRSASYYLRIHSIVPAGPQAKTYDTSKPVESYTIGPGEVVMVVSKEIFSITDPGVTALVTLRSTFTKQGLLALDVGLVDANFKGPIGSVVINFSKNDVHVGKEEEFFRVIFIRHDALPPNHQSKGANYTHISYTTDGLKRLVSGYSSSFLQTDDLRDKIKRDVTNELRASLSKDLIVSFLKAYWIWVLLAILLIAIVVVASAYWIIVELAPPIRLEDLQGYIRQYLEQQVSPSSPGGG